MRWLDKVTNEEVLRRVNEDRQVQNSVWQRKRRWIGHVFRHDVLLHEIKLLKAEWEVNQQEGGEFKCYTIWQMMVALLHSNGQLRTEKNGDIEKRCCTSEWWWWRWFDWSFAHLIACVVTTTTVILSSNTIQHGDIPGLSFKMAVKLLLKLLLWSSYAFQCVDAVGLATGRASFL